MAGSLLWIITLRRRKEKTLSVELAIIIPTYNERENIKPLLGKIEKALEGVIWEVIFVDDDSSDGTAQHIRDMAAMDNRIRFLQRIGRRGLSSACIEGMLVTIAPYLAIMDADMQHDETLLRKMLAILKAEDLDIVIGSRYVKGSDTGTWSKERVAVSRFATLMSRIVIHSELKDPLSGFFVLKRTFFEKVMRHLSGKGFKILLDLCASSPEKVRFKELPYQFRSRYSGKSKLDTLVVWEYFILVIDKLIGRIIPVRFTLFVMVGASGAIIHLAVLGICLKILRMSFVLAQSWATFFAMTVNFIFNNIFTYHDLKLKDWKFFKGLFSFYLACGIGVVVNVRIALFLYGYGISWWVAGLLGAVAGGVWNYAVTSNFTWVNKK